MTAGDSKVATTITQPALVSSPQSRPAPTRRALPSKPVAQRGQNWTPIRGQICKPIDTVCASCGSGMTRTGTNRRGKSYSYYSCAGCQQKGKTVCKGRHIPAAVLDDIIVSNLMERLLTPD